jgi:hypothetical protein
MMGIRSVGPQQIELARIMLAEVAGHPLYSELAVTMPRRASKTTTIWCVLLGLCALRPGFKVVTTAQTYVKARERFLEVERLISPRNVGEFRTLRGAAAEAIEWTNGSRLWVVTPEGGAFRGDGADVIVFDEAQEHGPDKTADLLGGAAALMDTRFEDDADLTQEDAQGNGQLIVTGTAGTAREGMLWDFLERGRAGLIGILEYAVPDETPLAYELDTPEGKRGVKAGWQVSLDGKRVLNEPAIIAAHPGIGTLTTLGIIRARFTTLALPQFIREYGGQWPYDANTRAISPELWAAGHVEQLPDYPEVYALGFDVAPDQSSAALCAAWRDAEGNARVEVICHEGGDGWLAKAIHERTKRKRDLLVGYDSIGPNQAVATQLDRIARPRPRLHRLGTADIVAAASQVSQDIRGGTFLHPLDPGLDAAADVARRRSIGDGSWAWGRRLGVRDGGDIAPLVAASNALRLYDTQLAATAHRTTRRRIVTAAAS